MLNKGRLVKVLNNMLAALLLLKGCCVDEYIQDELFDEEKIEHCNGGEVEHGDEAGEHDNDDTEFDSYAVNEQ